MYRYETHCHNNVGSACGWSTPEEMVQMYAEKGYHGVFITDHFWHGNTAISRDLPWEQWVESFCKAYERAKAKGDELGIDVFFGWEYSYLNSDFLTYGLDKEWLLRHPDCVHWNISEYLDQVHLHGGAIVQAHPFRMGHYVSQIRLLPLQCDGMEVYNGGNWKQSFNDQAKWFAEQYHLTQTSGSDSHGDNWSFMGGIETEHKILSAKDYAERLIARESFSLILGPERNED